MAIDLKGRLVPPRALGISAAALAVPVGGALYSEQIGDYGALLWLMALLPAFLLAYYRAWRGIATALALGMATLSVTLATVLAMGRAVPNTFFGVVVAYLVISLGIGWLAEALHGERAEVEDLAFTDLLTKLPNRRHARLFLENEFAAAERVGRQLSLVMFDLDRFKRYNDEFGHPGGDLVLREFADILERTTRRMDLSARFGGEEFLSVLTATGTEGALIFGDRIRAQLAQTDMKNGAGLTVSAGVATYHPSMRSPDELLGAADQALYEAKRAGRNRVRLFGRGMIDAALPFIDAPAEPLRTAPPDVVRPNVDTGRARPPNTVLPHHVTGFGRGRRVLVVEDDHQVRSLVGNYLEREGFEVDQVVDVATGLDAISREYDVVITDLRLPGAPGTALVTAVKSRWPLTQILVITGLHDPSIAAEALAAGADRYVFKPFGMPEMRRHLIDALNHRDRIVERRTASAALGVEALERRAAAKQAVLEATSALVRALEARDPYVAQHAARMGALAARLAAEIDPGERLIDREGLALGCRLHDIGKLGLGDAVLNKEGSLAPHESQSMEQHPKIGRSLLRPLLDDEVALAVVGWHHERWDGTGYPDGLAGESIPHASRVAAVCDSLDAMTSDRAHRCARSWDAAVAEILDKSGSWYDPDVVAAMVACVHDLHEIVLSFRDDEGDP